MDRLAREGMRFTERLCDDAALLAEPRELPHRPVRAHQRHHRQHRAAQPRSGHVSARAAARRLRDGLLRQVAHGQRRQPAARLHALGRDARAGRGDRSAPQRRRPAAAGEGLRHRRAHRLRRAVHPARRTASRSSPTWRTRRSIPTSIQQDDGRRRADARTAGRLRRGRASSRPLRGPDHAAAANAFKPPIDKPALMRRIGIAAAARTRDRDHRRRDSRPGRDAARRGRQPRPHPRPAREERRARQHRGRVHERSRLLLRRARAERGAAARLRGDDSHSAARPLPAAHQGRRGRIAARAEHRPGADAARAGRASRRDRNRGPIARARSSPARPARLARVVPDRVLQRHRLPARPEHGLLGGADHERRSTSSTASSRG